MANTNQRANWLQEIEDCPAGKKLIISGPTLQEAESEIREWLTTLNDVCRIASFFQVACPLCQWQIWEA